MLLLPHLPRTTKAFPDGIIVSSRQSSRQGKLSGREGKIIAIGIRSLKAFGIVMDLDSTPQKREKLFGTAVYLQELFHAFTVALK